MYAHIEGIVAEKTPDAIVLDANGVGYLLNVSGATLNAAPVVGERMKLFCVLNVREDAMELCGFYSREAQSSPMLPKAMDWTLTAVPQE